MLPTKIWFHWSRGFRGEDLKLEAQWAEPVSLTFHSASRKLNTEPPIGVSHQVLVIWLRSYREEDIQKSTNQKQEWPVAAMFINRLELNEQSLQMIFQDASYQVSIHLAKWFQRRRFFQKSTNQKQELPLVAMFVKGSELNEEFYKGPSKMLPTKFRSIWLSEAVSEETIFQKSTNQKQELPVAAMYVNGSELNEQSLQKTFQG